MATGNSRMEGRTPQYDAVMKGVKPGVKKEVKKSRGKKGVMAGSGKGAPENGQ